MSACMEIVQQLESENMYVKNANSKIIAEMQAIRRRVDTFFTEDLYRDVPTGTSIFFIIIHKKKLIYLVKIK